MMLNEQEKEFIEYWGKKRTQNKLNPFFLMSGFAGGLIIGLLVILGLAAGWYKRATMEASSQLNPFVLLIAVAGISLFVSIFYNSFKFEQNEQTYNELKNKERK
jgi:hypothetical protein